MLKQPAYAGLVHISGEVFEGKHDPIVDAATWEQTQALRLAKRKTASTNQTRTVAPTEAAERHPWASTCS